MLFLRRFKIALVRGFSSLEDSLLRADIGLIGLAVMSQNLVLNMADHGFHVAVYNRSLDKVDTFITGHSEPSFYPW